MAGEAAYGAWVDRAAPIAQDDAGKYTNVADRNMDAQNTFRLSDKEFGQTFALQKDDQGWKKGENALDRSLTASEGAANRGNSITFKAWATLRQWQDSNLLRAGSLAKALDRTFDSTEADKARGFTTSEREASQDWTSQEKPDRRRA